MDKKIRTSLALSTGMALAVFAASALAQNQPAGESESGAQPQRTIQMVQTQAQLSNTLDAKKAKQGEQVKARLADNVQIPNAQELPKGSILEGHVDQVQPSDHKSDSTVVVTFDKVKLKDGKELPVKATVVGISEPANQFQQQGRVPASPGAMPSGGPAPQAGGPSGPGGGMGASPNMPSTQPAPMPEEGGAGAEQQAAQRSQKNGVPGVMLTSDIHQHTSATFTSKGRNVKLPDGTQMQVALAIVPPGVNIQ